MTAKRKRARDDDDDDDDAKDRRSKTRKTRRSLPYKIVPVKNGDKELHEKWYEGRDPVNIPSPYRWLFTAKPDGGKTTAALTIIAHTQDSPEPFEQIIVVHRDWESTREYDDVAPEEPDPDVFQLRGDIPAIEELDEQRKKLMICEDLEYNRAAVIEPLESMLRYGSTHKFLAVMIMSQNPFGTSTTMRRCLNGVVLWNNRDLPMISAVAQRLFVPVEAMLRLVRKYLVTEHDSLWFDFTNQSPYPVRLNGFTKIDESEYMPGES
jgi:hypothetical protein